MSTLHFGILATVFKCQHFIFFLCQHFMLVLVTIFRYRHFIFSCVDTLFWHFDHFLQVSTLYFGILAFCYCLQVSTLYFSSVDTFLATVFRCRHFIFLCVDTSFWYFGILAIVFKCRQFIFHVLTLHVSIWLLSSSVVTLFFLCVDTSYWCLVAGFRCQHL